MKNEAQITNFRKVFRGVKEMIVVKSAGRKRENMQLKRSSYSALHSHTTKYVLQR